MISYEEIVAILGVIGVSGLLATSLGYFLEKRKQRKFSEQRWKARRYKSILVQMRVILHPENIKYVKAIRPDLISISDWKNEIQEEWFNSWLFASDDVIKALKAFILNPNYANYGKTVLAMRKDLWNIKTSLNAEECKINQV